MGLSAWLCLVVLGVRAGRDVQVYRIAGSSMEPALSHGDWIVGLTRHHGDDHSGSLTIAPARRGEVVVFTVPPLYRDAVVKRVAGIEGDTLEMLDGNLLVNGRWAMPLVRETDTPVKGTPDSWHYRYLIDSVDLLTYAPSPSRWGPIVVPHDSLFVLGDNLEHSGDSRRFGFIANREVIAHSPLALSLSPVPRLRRLGRPALTRLR